MLFSLYVFHFLLNVFCPLSIVHSLVHLPTNYSIFIYIYIYNSKSLDVVQSLYFGSKLPSSGMYK